MPRRGVSYGGLMTYPRAGLRKEADAFLQEARELTAKAGLDTRTVSSGGSPDMWKDEGLSSVTEYRAGTYVYFDRALSTRGTCSLDDCALRVLATVVSRPAPERALIDAGSKALTSDLLGLQGYGLVRELDEILVHEVNEEHGFPIFRRRAASQGWRLVWVTSQSCLSRQQPLRQGGIGAREAN